MYHGRRIRKASPRSQNGHRIIGIASCCSIHVGLLRQCLRRNLHDASRPQRFTTCIQRHAAIDHPRRNHTADRRRSAVSSQPEMLRSKHWPVRRRPHVPPAIHQLRAMRPLHEICVPGPMCRITLSNRIAVAIASACPGPDTAARHQGGDGSLAWSDVGVSLISAEE